MKFKTQPLTEAQLRQILQVPDCDLVRAFPGYTRDFLRAEKNRASRDMPVEMRLDLDRERAQSKAERQELQRLYNQALEDNKRLRHELSLAANLPDVNPRAMAIPKAKPGEREATGVALASDWHGEETVESEQVNGLNEFNLAVFDARAKRFFSGVRKLVDKEARDITINNLVLWLGGDLLSGNIHEDIAESSQLGPMDALALVQDTLAGGINALLKETPKSLTLTVPVSVGNHSRITDEQRVQTEHENSLEWFMGFSLAREFKDNQRVRFVRQRAYHTYLDVHGFSLRFHHGHAIGYSGGVGGITIPVNKKIAEWNKGRRAAIDCFGHFHQLFFGPNFVANGSLIGYSPYAIKIGAAYQPPQQAFFLVDSKYGLTVRAPILLDEPVVLGVAA